MSIFLRKVTILDKWVIRLFNQDLSILMNLLIFGAPIVQNRYLRIPFLAAPIVMSLCTYIMMAYHYINIPVMLAPWVLPSVFEASGTGWSNLSILYIIGMIIVSLIIYLPFFICYDRN